MSEINWQFQYTLHLWPSLICVVILAVLSVYAWRNRSVPGALPFAVLCWLSLPQAVSSALVHASAAAPAKIFWMKVEIVWSVPIATAALWFALDYADLSRWLSRRTLWLLATPPIIIPVLALTNSVHHLVWLSLSTESRIVPEYGILGWMIYFYHLFLLVGALVVFISLFVRSPLHRWPATVCLAGLLAVLLSVVLDYPDLGLVAVQDRLVIAGVFAVIMFGLALLYLWMFNLMPIAHGTAIEQMCQGVLVLDCQQRIVNMNPAAEEILGVAASHVRGIIVTEVAPEYAEGAAEISRGNGNTARHYSLHRSMLKNSHGFPLGSLILLRDMTEQKQAQAETLEQQRVQATLRERERVARELHDSLGQVLGYVKMQTEAARALLARGQAGEADACLARLSDVAQEAHDDVREYILSTKSTGDETPDFLPTLEAHIQQFTRRYGIVARLVVAPTMADRSVEPMVGTQLLRIIQEALSNVRKHAGPCSVQISVGASDGWAEAVVQDDGLGFDPARVGSGSGEQYGLSSMRERAQEVGGSLEIVSALGKGTQVVVRVPLRKEHS